MQNRLTRVTTMENIEQPPEPEDANTCSQCGAFHPCLEHDSPEPPRSVVHPDLVAPRG
jgi:hypothetical protein